MSICYSCDGTLLVPSDPDRGSRWREHLMSGRRMTVVLETFDDRRSDEGHLLRGENYRQEKQFEVNLRNIKSYFIRNRNWHEVTANDDRKFVLTFDESKEFSIFYEQLIKALKSVEKFSTDMERDPNGKIVVLRVDRVPPQKPPRIQANNASTDGNSGVDVCDGCPPRSPDDYGIRRSVDLEKKEGVKRSSWGLNCNKRPSTVWYSDVCDSQSQNNENLNNFMERSGESENVYDTIGDVENNENSGENSKRDGNSTEVANETNRKVRISDYDNVNFVHYSKPIKPKRTQVDDCTARYEPDSRNFDVYDNRTTNADADPKSLIAQLSLTSKSPLQNPTTNTPVKPPTTTDVRNADPGPPTHPVPKPRARRSSPSEEECWTCRQCTLINPLTAARCVACESPRNQPESAERKNELSRHSSSYVVSSAAFHSLTSTAAAAAAEDEGWLCSRCSTRNCRGRKLCSSCSSWVCGQCTLHNYPDHLLCFACSSPRCQSI